MQKHNRLWQKCEYNMVQYRFCCLSTIDQSSKTSCFLTLKCNSNYSLFAKMYKARKKLVQHNLHLIFTFKLKWKYNAQCKQSKILCGYDKLAGIVAAFHQHKYNLLFLKWVFNIKGISISPSWRYSNFEFERTFQEKSWIEYVCLSNHKKTKS